MRYLRYFNHHDFWLINDVHMFFTDKSAVKPTRHSSTWVFSSIPSLVIVIDLLKHLNYHINESIVPALSQEQDTINTCAL